METRQSFSKNEQIELKKFRKALEKYQKYLIEDEDENINTLLLVNRHLDKINATINSKTDSIIGNIGVQGSEKIVQQETIEETINKVYQQLQEAKNEITIPDDFYKKHHFYDSAVTFYHKVAAKIEKKSQKKHQQDDEAEIVPRRSYEKQ